MTTGNTLPSTLSAGQLIKGGTSDLKKLQKVD